jgi:hypothetical protein
LKDTTYFNRSHYTADEYAEHILPPTKDYYMMFDGMCENTTVNNPLPSYRFAYELIPDSPCGPDTRFYTSHEQPLSTVFNYNNAVYDILAQKYPYLDQQLSGMTIKLGVEYPFSRQTISCLMSNYDTLFKYYSKPSIGTQFYKNKEKLKHVLEVFIKLPDQIYWGKVFQIIILSINCALVFNQVLNAIIAIVNEFRTNKVTFYVEFQPIFNLIIDLITMSLGAITYFVLYSFLSFVTNVLYSGCIDGFTKSKLQSYEAEVMQACDKNLEYLIFVGIKVVVVTWNILMHIKTKEKITCKEFCTIIKTNWTTSEFTKRLGGGDKDKDDKDDAGKGKEKAGMIEMV